MHNRVQHAVAYFSADRYAVSVDNSSVGRSDGGPMSREFSVVIERDEEGYYVASVPALPGCHTQARSLDELMDRVREAIALCLEVKGEDTSGLEFIGVQRVRIPACVASSQH